MTRQARQPARPGRRRNTIMPPDWWAAIERDAKRRGETVSEWLRAAAGVRLGKIISSKLSHPKPAGRPPSDD